MVDAGLEQDLRSALDHDELRVYYELALPAADVDAWLAGTATCISGANTR